MAIFRGARRGGSPGSGALSPAFSRAARPAAPLAPCPPTAPPAAQRPQSHGRPGNPRWRMPESGRGWSRHAGRGRLHRRRRSAAPIGSTKNCARTRPLCSSWESDRRCAPALPRTRRTRSHRSGCACQSAHCAQETTPASEGLDDGRQARTVPRFCSPDKNSKQT